jgi:hypothetical protein
VRLLHIGEFRGGALAFGELRGGALAFGKLRGGALAFGKLRGDALAFGEFRGTTLFLRACGCTTHFCGAFCGTTCFFGKLGEPRFFGKLGKPLLLAYLLFEALPLGKLRGLPLRFRAFRDPAGFFEKARLFLPLREKLLRGALLLAPFRLDTLSFRLFRGEAFFFREPRCAALFFRELRRATLFFRELRRATLFCRELRCAALFFRELRRATLFCRELRRPALFFRELRRATLLFGLLRAKALPFGALGGTTLFFGALRGTPLPVGALRGAALFFSALRGAALLVGDLLRTAFFFAEQFLLPAQFVGDPRLFVALGETLLGKPLLLAQLGLDAFLLRRRFGAGRGVGQAGLLGLRLLDFGKETCGRNEDRGAGIGVVPNFLVLDIVDGFATLRDEITEKREHARSIAPSGYAHRGSRNRAAIARNVSSSSTSRPESIRSWRALGF